MEQYEEVEFVSATQREINNVHDPVGFLQEVESLLPLLSFDELYGWVIQFSQDYWYLVLADPELFVVMFVESIILIESPSSWPTSLIITSSLRIAFLDTTLISWSYWRPVCLCSL